MEEYCRAKEEVVYYSELDCYMSDVEAGIDINGNRGDRIGDEDRYRRQREEKARKDAEWEANWRAQQGLLHSTRCQPISGSKGRCLKASRQVKTRTGQTFLSFIVTLPREGCDRTYRCPRSEARWDRNAGDVW
jgi:hypothetical protein